MSEQITTDKFGEQLSALMDGELPQDQLRFLLRRIDADAGLVQRWSRYQVVRASLRRQMLVPLRANFTEILMQRIGHEAVPMSHRRGSVVLRWAGGGAIAAAVAVVALVATRPPAGNSVTPVLSVAAISIPAAAAPDARSMAPAQALVNFDYAQPASFDTAISIPRYDVRRRNEATGMGTANAFQSYVLRTAPQSPQAASNPAETQQQQQ